MTMEENNSKWGWNYLEWNSRQRVRSRNQKRHSNFYIGLHANAWVESWQMFAIETQELMNLIPPKCANYTKSCFEKLITIGHKLAKFSWPI